MSAPKQTKVKHSRGARRTRAEIKLLGTMPDEDLARTGISAAAQARRAKDNSPAFQRWVCGPNGEQVPSGTKENGSHLYGFCRPYGA